jgi:hypothetical protein
VPWSNTLPCALTTGKTMTLNLVLVILFQMYSNRTKPIRREQNELDRRTYTSWQRRFPFFS